MHSAQLAHEEETPQLGVPDVIMDQTESGKRRQQVQRHHWTAKAVQTEQRQIALLTL